MAAPARASPARFPTHREVLGAFTLLAASSPALGDSTRPYSEGRVIELSFVKVEPGMFDVYMTYLSTTYKDVMEAEKKAGLILDYHVYGAEARTPQDADLILTVTYANWAALDGLEEKAEALSDKTFGSRQQANAAMIDREKMRKILGTERIQELVLK
jgi:hypothetical protein